ncbi:ribokinase [Thalassomonas actiniarum]|uniref:Ribokinase n=1 Tax=Thalassomonas actiniarum TaxID=485447 RepID=A0AAE9YMM1_9GAMM|nr:ribokinase [Thalassomonas actiniarum]WDD97053.1 ribokinase [Thalassomonas actiniarum]
MTIFNFGSINIDHVYSVDHFVRPGETMTSDHYQKILGGKGANQSVALAKAGCDVVHVGAISKQDTHLLAELEGKGVNTEQIATLDLATGHAIIQVNKEAENAIVLFAGANHALNAPQIKQVLANADKNDWVLLQNETNEIDTIITTAKAHGLTVVYNPAPMDKSLVEKHLADIDLLIVNEVEAMDLAGVDNVDAAQSNLVSQHPNLQILMTLGAEGVRYLNGEAITQVPAFKVKAVDTTAAGDTFIGYALAGFTNHLSVENVLRQACAASAICVTREGASTAIPGHEEVSQFLKEK